MEEGRHLKVRVVPVSNAAVATYGTKPQKWSLVADQKICDSDSLGDMPKVPQLVGRRASPACLLALAFPLQGVEEATAALLLTLSVQEALAFSRH